FAASKSMMQIVVSDSIRAWGFGSPADSHGATTEQNMGFMNSIVPGIARFTSYAGGHCCWNNYYNPGYKEMINGKSLNIYEWLLMHSRTQVAVTANAGQNQSLTLPASSLTHSGSGWVL